MYKQLEGIDFFEKYAPVIHCTTVCLLNIWVVLMGLKSKQCIITAAFLDVDLEEYENIFINILMGFGKKLKVLKLRKTFYGLRQSPT